MTDRPKTDAKSGKQPNLRLLLCIVGAAAILAAFAFTVYPGIDIDVSKLFQVAKHKGFVFNYPGPGHALRRAFRLLFWGSLVVVVAGLIMSALGGKRPLSFGFPKWLFLFLCLALGPGLLVNGLLKEHWGRSRPIQTVEFGGATPFTPALQPTRNCKRNCSFVSGEASTSYVLFFALALLVHTGRIPLVLLGLAAGTGAGLVRVAQGGHFLSDVVFAGILMALLTLFLYWVIFRQGEKLFAEGGPVHAKVLGSWASLGPAERTLAIILSVLLVGTAASLRLAEYRKGHRADLAFDGARVLVIPTNLQTDSYSVDLMLRSKENRRELARRGKSELPMVFRVDKFRIIEFPHHYSFQIDGIGEIAATGNPASWQRVTFVAAGGSKGRLFLNGSEIWSGSGLEPIDYSSFFLGASSGPSRFWHGDAYRIDIYKGAATDENFDPNENLVPPRGRLYVRQVNPDINQPPRIP